ncbi:hypothetical protein BG60_12005 [Caballeronia zhejiangensis]|uniref:Uncharacterized protein n=1 Tax=Caballeronia zhejiangensis TaxID=871203 RepID=A0A656QVH9_9BURK|nr:hypothetical protein BURK_028735 [Burkholderia sp. SJ98]KDR33274.1 hypothetical protein BG60_12005 [Caballeronia zhejiangensis]
MRASHVLYGDQFSRLGKCRWVQKWERAWGLSQALWIRGGEEEDRTPDLRIANTNNLMFLEMDPD